MLLIRNLKSFFSSDKILSSAFCVLMVICISGGIFGINYADCNKEFYNNYYYSLKRYEIKNHSADSKNAIIKFLDDYGDDVDYMQTSFSCEFDGAKRKINSVVRVSDVYLKNFSTAYGRMLSKSEIAEGENKIVLCVKDFSTDYIGKTIDINGAKYQVIGLSADENYIPYNFSKEFANAHEIEFYLKLPIKNKKLKQEFSQKLNSIFMGMTVIVPESNFKTIWNYAPMMLPSLLLLVVGFLNLSFLYIFFIKKRAKQYSVYRICGAKKTDILGLFVGEVSVLYSGAFILATLIYKIVMLVAFPGEISIETMANTNFVIYDSLSALKIIATYFILIFMCILSFLPVLLKNIRNDISLKGGN